MAPLWAGAAVRDTGFIRLEHGSGGALSRELIETVIYPAFRSDAYPELSDAGPIAPGADLLVTTDGYVVDPPFFPGGDIGRLAVFGTCNDLAVSAAEPVCLALALIIEEGFPLDDLRRVIQSAAEAARAARVRVVTGDTKVVPRGTGGGVYITTTGIGRRILPHSLSVSRIGEGDTVIVSGPIGAHGLAILAARESLPVGSGLLSDTALLFPLASGLCSLGGSLRFMRDATRGGVAAVLNEIAGSGASDGLGWGIEVDEESFPVSPEVRTVSDLLGLNPLEVANEGVLVAVVANSALQEALAILHALPGGRAASMVGRVSARNPRTVTMRTRMGGTRVLDYPRGLLLPRIC
ncbi:MAG: hydrogenase expression/formation protein HypE [Spirochaetes bacterium]|nr:hydrogenase expression/formation protein HypE [Spirochaetota bacterium]